MVTLVLRLQRMTREHGGMEGWRLRLHKRIPDASGHCPDEQLKGSVSVGGGGGPLDG